MKKKKNNNPETSSDTDNNVVSGDGDRFNNPRNSFHR
jgi:hypothetical protein